MDKEQDIQLPEWLTDELIEELKEHIASCDNPYTAEECDNADMETGKGIDWKRFNASESIRILTEYGII